MDDQKQNPSVVLVVEDDPLMLLDAVELIAGAGFEALPASNADDAIFVLQSRDDIKVIFTDINMPGSMDGLNLAHAVRGQWPPIEIIVTSGLTLGTRQLPWRAVFLSKPYTPAQLTGALHNLAA